MAAPAKYNEVMSVIKRRISEGDYLVDSIPGERRLAEETGVSYMTARRAVRQLLDEEVLIRAPSGSLDVHPSYSKRTKPAEVVLLYPAYPSSYLTQLRGVVSEFADRRGQNLRPAQFVHWDEQAVFESVAQAKGTVVIPHGPPIPSRLMEHFKNHKVVVLDGDFADHGIPSVRLFSDSCVLAVMEHLRRLGHRRVDCLNTQNRNVEIDRRIDIWRQWREDHGIVGQLHDDPAPNYTDPTIVAYRMMAELLDRDGADATAFVATTCPAAIGAIRACYERGVQVGPDVSIAAVNLEPPAEFFCPSITGLNTPDLTTVLAKCFDWFASGEPWLGSRLMEPADSALFRGESSTTPPKRARGAAAAKRQTAWAHRGAHVAGGVAGFECGDRSGEHAALNNNPEAAKRQSGKAAATPCRRDSSRS